MKLIPTTLEQIIKESNSDNRYIALQFEKNFFIGSEWLSYNKELPTHISFLYRCRKCGASRTYNT